MAVLARALMIMIPAQGDGDTNSIAISTACHTAQANIADADSSLTIFCRSLTQDEAKSKHKTLNKRK